MESWVFLLVGGLGAIGAALSIGTLAALVQYRRHGTLPGQDQDHDSAQGEDQAREQDQGPDEAPPPPEPGIERRLWVRIVMGAVVAVVCFGSLAQQGLLFGSLLG